MKEDIKYLIIDLFAGAGGVTTGIERAKDKFGNKVAKVIAAVNHDPKAIESHSLNHPGTYHFIEDVRNLDLSKLASIIEVYQKRYPKAKLALWTSAECTHHSIAKGGPKEEGSRSLPFVILEYLKIANFDMVLVENVKEFLDWGPLNEKGYPIKERKGDTYKEWRDAVKALGYDYNYVIDNAADFGAYTSRIRYFGSFTRPGVDPAFPKPTHAKNPNGGLLPWKKVRDVLELWSHGKSIFAPPGKKKKSDNTFRRIYEGLIRHVGNDYFIQYNGTSHCQSIDKPCGTLTTKDRFAKVSVQMLDQQYGNSKPVDLDRPSPTLTAIPKVNLLTAQFLDNPQWGGATWDINRPCFTLIARMDKAPPSLISAEQGSPIKLKEDDMPYERKVKEFMIRNGMSDIKMRMLEVEEMLDIMGFGRDYQLIGGITDKKRFIGNAVVCDYTQAWFEEMSNKHFNYECNNM